MSAKTSQISSRDEVPAEYKWDLSSLYKNDDAWEEDLKRYMQRTPEIDRFKGTLGESAEKLADCLAFMNQMNQLQERLGYYAHLKLSEDVSDSRNHDRFSRFMQAATAAEARASYQTPEIQAIPDERMEQFLATPALEEFEIALRKILRYKPHVLSEAEERLLALQQEPNQTAQKSFGALTDADMEFGEVETPDGPQPLTHASFGSFMEHPDRDVRARAYEQFFSEFIAHKNTLANLYSGSVQLDIYQARVRNFDSARAARLFPDDVPESVYDNLVETVSSGLEQLHRYYDLRRRALGIERLELYDTKVPLVPELTVEHTYEEAVEVVVEALAPLGEEYCRVLHEGLLGGWVDRYENKGKRSGAFSAGSYDGWPYILMNFREDLLRDVFTLAHEGGHSMHSWYSTRNNPFQHYDYTIFEAEVASTFNEQLLAKHLMERSEDPRMQAYLVNKQIDDLVGTLFRQTMFAEYEAITHSSVEAGRPLTVDSLRSEYRRLLEKYFGPDVNLHELADIEGFRIPHFYRAFYVYKYATGISAAVSLARQVIHGNSVERDRYLEFLKSGGSRFPIESLRLAGVEMTESTPVEVAIEKFSSLIDRLETLLKELRQL